MTFLYVVVDGSVLSSAYYVESSNFSVAALNSSLESATSSGAIFVTFLVVDYGIGVPFTRLLFSPFSSHFLLVSSFSAVKTSLSI